ncbi:MAG: hypothetical protein COA70_04225 [Planctomycetota bacterium]|nr:MAG: hypothetical protein COA70_04225 [Planctomycetota bacterium]
MAEVLGADELLANQLMKINKPIKMLALALALTGLGFLCDAIGGRVQVWNPERQEMEMIFFIFPTLFVIGFIQILSSGKNGAEHFSNGCAIGTIFLMAILGLIAFAYLADIGSWA